MKMSIRHAAGAAALLSLSQPAMAQGTPCVQPADFADAVTYAIPMMMQSAQTSCAETLAADSYVMSEGDAFASRFTALQDQSWPGAKRFLMTFVESDATTKAMGAMLGELDDETLRPFVDGIVSAKIAEDIKPATCASIEKILPLVAPLPAENYGQLLVTVMELTGKTGADLKLCPVAQ